MSSRNYQKENGEVSLKLARIKLHRFKTESVTKLSNFNFKWTKTLYQNNLNNIAFFSIFQGLLDVISYL